ncbi:alcohol dehydrogenase catalytic domain-containing protein [Nonomuraea sp. NPDC050310]|uniref:alcohol dehydrogenase catalytic domain-containing protein n=1 Tax=Nonomuraea sp. NPDC050310 TaxID=3154935 RepID=UPI0033D46AA5
MLTRAAVLTAFDAPMAIHEVELDDPGPGEVLVRVKASGVCGSDLKALLGKSPVVSRLPYVLGHESAGIVESVGPGVTTVAPGDHVIIAMNGPCGACPRCGAGDFHLCTGPARLTAIMGGPPRMRLDGAEVRRFIGIGSFAEHALVADAMCVKIPPHAPFAAMALLACGVITGVGAVLNVARVRPGSSVLVVGCGGVGLNVIQGAVLAGATTIIAADVAEAKLKLAARFGATHTVPADALPADVDYAFDATGAPGVLARAFAATRPGGTTVMVGSPPRGVPLELDPGLLFASRRLLGTQGGDAVPRRDLPMLVDQYLLGRLDLDGLISAQLPLEELDTALTHLQHGSLARTVITL